MKASEALARKIQADLDQMGDPLTHILLAERQKDLDEIFKHLSAEQWDNLATQVSARLDLEKSVLGVAYHEADFAKRMVEAAKLKKRPEAERIAKEKRDKPWKKAKIRDYMRIFFKNQGCAMYG